MENEFTINMITLGDVEIGKTSIINWIKDKTFKEFYKSTVSLECFIIKKIWIKKIEILPNPPDMSGQEWYQKPILLIIFVISHVTLLVFSDLDSIENFKRRRWFNFYKKNTSIYNSKFILVGNKSYIFGDKRDEIINQGNKFAEEIDAHFITCQIKSKDNMDNLDRYTITEARRFIDEEE